MPSARLGPTLRRPDLAVGLCCHPAHKGGAVSRYLTDPKYGVGREGYTDPGFELGSSGLSHMDGSLEKPYDRLGTRTKVQTSMVSQSDTLGDTLQEIRRCLDRDIPPFPECEQVPITRYNRGRVACRGRFQNPIVGIVGHDLPNRGGGFDH